MPEEPKKPIEELLEAHAMKRRAEGGFFELHEATRRVLQGEALRIHGKQEETRPGPSKRSAWFLLWTRLAGAFGVIALLGGTAFVIHQMTPAPEMEMAQRGPTAGEISKAPQPAAAPVLGGSLAGEAGSEAPAGASRMLSDAVSRSAPVAESAPLQKAMKPVAPVPADAPRPAGFAQPLMAKAETAAASFDGAVATGTIANAKIVSRMALSGTVFRRVDQDDGLRRNLQSPALPDVLKTFNASVLGSRLRIEEADGSIYLGDIAPGGATFTVIGTNHTTGLTVRFMGRATMSVPEGSSARGALADVPSVLEGTVALGDRQQWRLRAEAQR